MHHSPLHSVTKQSHTLLRYLYQPFFAIFSAVFAFHVLSEFLDYTEGEVVGTDGVDGGGYGLEEFPIHPLNKSYTHNDLRDFTHKLNLPLRPHIHPTSLLLLLPKNNPLIQVLYRPYPLQTLQLLPLFRILLLLFLILDNLF